MNVFLSPTLASGSTTPYGSAATASPERPSICKETNAGGGSISLTPQVIYFRKGTARLIIDWKQWTLGLIVNMQTQERSNHVRHEPAGYDTAAP